MFLHGLPASRDARVTAQSLARHGVWRTFGVAHFRRRCWYGWHGDWPRTLVICNQWVYDEEGAFAFVLVFLFYVFLVILPLLLKYKSRMSGKRGVNCESFPSGQIPPSSQTFAGISRGSRAVDLASTAVTANGVCYIAWKTIMVITSSYVWPDWLNWKEYVCNLHQKCIPEFPTLNLEITDKTCFEKPSSFKVVSWIRILNHNYCKLLLKI